MINSTADFLGPVFQWASARMELDAIQPLWGGCRVLVEGGGRVLVRKVEKGGTERRYVLALPPEEIQCLFEAAVRADFCSIRIESRPGIPDELRLEIRLRNAAGDARVVSKWARQAHAGFDALVRELSEIAERAALLEPVFEGTFDWTRLADGI